MAPPLRFPLERRAFRSRLTPPTTSRVLLANRERRTFMSLGGYFSAFSILSIFSVGSILSIGSAGSILSIGSNGSILSIGSAGSVLSIGSAGSVLSIGAAGGMLQRGRRKRHDTPPARPDSDAAV